jgi:P2-related tail formation protein
MAEAILASAAISALVLPRRIGSRVATDGSWVRNFPLAHAYARPGVRLIVGFRYLPHYPALGTSGLSALRRRLEPFGRVPPVKALIAELREAEERESRGEPGHLPEMIMRLTRAAIVRNTVLEERLADEKDESIHEFARLRRDLQDLVAANVRSRPERAKLEEAIAARLDASRFPFRHDRAIPRVIVRGSIDGPGLEPSRAKAEWPVEEKRALIRRGYELADVELRAAAIAA